MLGGTWRAVYGGAVVAMLLAGCTAPAVEPTRSATQVAPAFPDKRQAENSARDVYQRYLDVSQRVAEDGGEDAERLRTVTTQAAYKRELAGIEAVKARGLTSSGEERLIAFRLEQANLQTGEVSAYACVDLSDVKVLDSKNKVVTPPNRPKRQTFRPRFVRVGNTVLVDENRTWSGSNIC